MHKPIESCRISPLQDITGLILAGGQGRRMGGQDKGLVSLAGQPLVRHVQARLTGRVAQIMISANRNVERYRSLGARVVSDNEPGYHGPLMGIYSGLRAAETPWVLVVPCDTPLLPDELVTRMVEAIGEHQIAVAHDGERLHPVVLLLEQALLDDLERALAAGERRVRAWLDRHSWTPAYITDGSLSFANLNTEEERRQLESRLNEESRLQGEPR